MFASEKCVSRLRKYSMLPIADHWMNDEGRINYWYKNLQSILIQGATYHIVCGKNFYQDLSRIHLIYAGYHGQGAFISAP